MIIACLPRGGAAQLWATFVEGTPAAEPPVLSSVTVTELTAEMVSPFAMVGGSLIGRSGGTALRISTDAGESWAPCGTSPVTFYAMLDTSDGEVVALGSTTIYKSSGWSTGSPTWSLKATTNGACQFQPWALRGDGTKFISTEYAASAGFPDSRYARVSFDSGTTWQVGYDSVALHGQTAADASHLHGCEYVPDLDRFYVSEGHTPEIGGVYFSDDDCATWTRATGMVMDPSPTTLVRTDGGVVGTSDSAFSGLYGIRHQANGADEEIIRTWAWRTGRDGTIGFGVHGFRDPGTGLVYCGFRTEFNDVAPVIAAGNVDTGGLVYQWALPAWLAYDDINRVFVPAPGVLIAVARYNGGTYLIRGTLGKPRAASVTLADTGNSVGGESASASSVSVGPRASTSGIRSLAIGVGAAVTATQDGVAIGESAQVGGTSGSAIGKSANAAPYGTAIGTSASAGNSGVAIGEGSSATSAVAVGRGVVAPSSSVVIGPTASVAVGSSAGSIGSSAVARNAGVAVGQGAKNEGNDAVAIGGSASAHSNGTAVGKSALVASNHSRSVALGHSAASSAADQLAIGPRHVEIGEVTAPTAPAADKARLYIEDDGTGKTRLMVRFATGAAVQVAIQP